MAVKYYEIVGFGDGDHKVSRSIIEVYAEKGVDLNMVLRMSIQANVSDSHPRYRVTEIDEEKYLIEKLAITHEDARIGRDLLKKVGDK